MPKIKLSALVSDMKGKANGSVFSKNSGGVYFRNNPSGGGKKSAKWDKQKSNFSSIARSWKSLTEAEQESWKAIVASYPTKNAFGEIRIPSGYELFCRLNGALTSAKIAGGDCNDDEDCATGYMCINNTCTLVGSGGGEGFPALKTPLSPRSVPSVGYVGINWSELFQLNPNKKLGLFNPLDLTQDFFLTSNNLIDDKSMFSAQSWAFRFEFFNKQNQIVDSSSRFFIYSCTDVNDLGREVTIINVLPNSFQIEIVSITSTGQDTQTITINKSLFSQAWHLIFTSGGTDATTATFFVNGLQVIPVLVHTGTYTNVNYEVQQKFRNDNSFDNAAFYISDYRYFKSQLSVDNAKLVSQGYVLDTEWVILDCITNTIGIFKNFGAGSDSFDFAISDATLLSSQLVLCSFALIPNFQIEVENTGLFDVYLNIYASPPCSWGKTGTNTNLKLLGSFYWDTEKTFDVYNQYKSVYGNVPANSNVDFYVQAIDSTTGDMLLTKTKGKKNKPRFKAGADLTEKVN